MFQFFVVILLYDNFFQLRNSLNKAFHRGHKRSGHKKENQSACPTPDRFSDRGTPSPHFLKTPPPGSSLLTTPATSETTLGYEFDILSYTYFLDGFIKFS